MGSQSQTRLSVQVYSVALGAKLCIASHFMSLFQEECLVISTISSFSHLRGSEMWEKGMNDLNGKG